jgi:hypothetical protein
MCEPQHQRRLEAVSGRTPVRRVGSGWLDHKLIADQDMGKVYGPTSTPVASGHTEQDELSREGLMAR